MIKEITRLPITLWAKIFVDIRLDRKELAYNRWFGQRHDENTRVRPFVHNIIYYYWFSGHQRRGDQNEWISNNKSCF